MKVAVVGCLHGELDIIYEEIQRMEREQQTTIDFLVVCGDFQAIRNSNDLKCIAVPDKYKRVGAFPDYYFGRKIAPKLTLLVGGNHEASNYLQTLPYGGWVAPNMYYLGLASVVQVGGLRVGGISGIFKYHHAKLGHFECLPYTPDTMRSVYHMRETEVYKLLQLTEKVRDDASKMSEEGPAQPEASTKEGVETKEDSSTKEEITSTTTENKSSPSKKPHRSLGKLDIFISHDWPINIHQCGNVGYLLRRKPFFREEVNEQRLGNPLLQPLVHHLQPRHWFAAHLHVSFNAIVDHGNGPHNPDGPPHKTQFQALDKVLPRRQFLQIFDIAPEGGDQLEQSSSQQPILSHDPEWLAILRKTDHLLKIHRSQIGQIDIFNAHNSVPVTDDDVAEVLKLMKGNLVIDPSTFVLCEPVTAVDVDLDPQRQRNFVNPQTTALTEKLAILDPNKLFRLESSGGDVMASKTPVVPAKANPDAISLSDDEDDDDDCCRKDEEGSSSLKKAKLEDESSLFVIDTVGSK